MASASDGSARPATRHTVAPALAPAAARPPPDGAPGRPRLGLTSAAVGGSALAALASHGSVLRRDVTQLRGAGLRGRCGGAPRSAAWLHRFAAVALLGSNATSPLRGRPHAARGIATPRTDQSDPNRWRPTAPPPRGNAQPSFTERRFVRQTDPLSYIRAQKRPLMPSFFLTRRATTLRLVLVMQSTTRHDAPFAGSAGRVDVSPAEILRVPARGLIGLLLLIGHGAGTGA